MTDASKVRLIFTGFQQLNGMRVLAYESIAADNSRTVLTVSADLALARNYGISLQDLPLLCRAILENPEREATGPKVIYTEEDMRVHAAGASARAKAAKQRRPPRRPNPNQPHTTESGDLADGQAAAAIAPGL